MLIIPSTRLVQTRRRARFEFQPSGCSSEKREPLLSKTGQNNDYYLDNSEPRPDTVAASGRSDSSESSSSCLEVQERVDGQPGERLGLNEYAPGKMVMIDKLDEMATQLIRFQQNIEDLRLMIDARGQGIVEPGQSVISSDKVTTLIINEPVLHENAARRQLAPRGSLETKMVLASQEYFCGESFEATVEMTSVGGVPIVLETLEGAIPKGFTIASVRGGVLSGDGSVELGCLKLDPYRVHRVNLNLKASVEGVKLLAPHVVFKDESGLVKMQDIRPIEIIVHPVSPIIEFLAMGFVEDYVTKRLSYEQAGWRGLLRIVDTLKIPKSQAYGEARYGHTFGRPLETLIRSELVEYRSFRGKGRGGDTIKVRACYRREPVKRLVDRLSRYSSSKLMGNSRIENSQRDAASTPPELNHSQGQPGVDSEKWLTNIPKD